MEQENSNSEKPSNVFLKLINGDYGLATTYWGFGVLGGFLFKFLHSTIANASFTSALLVYVINVIYGVVVIIGIWNASNKFDGSPIWAVAAQIIAAINLLVIGKSALDIIGALQI